MRIARALLLVVFVLLLSEPFGDRLYGQDRALEYQVKAAFLLNFVKFVEWPDGAFDRPDAALTICISGEDPFGTGLDATLEDEQVAGHPLVAQRLPGAEVPPNCNVLFIAGSEPERFTTILGHLGGESILTVGEAPEFISAGGAINFFLDGNRVRFAINPDAAARSGLRVSSKLLRVAQVVRDGQKPEPD